MKEQIKIKIIFTICILISTTIFSQTFEWVKPFGGLVSYVDDVGNFYTTGGFTGTTDFDPNSGVTNLSSVGSSDVFVQKIDPAGNLLWAKSFGGPAGDQANSIFVDGEGNVYTTGTFRQSVDFDPGSGSSIHVSLAFEDIFIHKMDASGNFLWVKSFQGAEYEKAFSISVDVSGNVYTTGRFIGTIDFNPGVGIANLSSAGGYDIFVLKLDAFGDFLWAKRMGSISHDNGRDICTDVNGNVYTAGAFQGLVDFDPGAGLAYFNSSSPDYEDVFVQKMDASGNFLWAKVFGGIYGDDIVLDICLDNSGNVYSVGNFYGNVDFDPSDDITTLTSKGWVDIFVHKMDSSGNFLWAKSFGGNDYDGGNSISVDSSGSVYTTGHFREMVDINPGVGTTNLFSEGARDLYVQKMDTHGNFLWAVSYGSQYDEDGVSVVVDASDNLYTMGVFGGIIDFDPGVGISNLNANTHGPLFVLKMNQSTAGITALLSGINITSFPNPNNGLVQISCEKLLSDVEITVTNFQGEVVYLKQFDTFSNVLLNIEGTSGIYFLFVTTSDKQSVVKLIKE